MSEVKIVKERVGLPSKSLIERLMKKYPAFVPADVSEKAAKEGVRAPGGDYKGRGFYYTSTPFAESFEKVVCVIPGGCIGWRYSNYSEAGLRAAFSLIYNPKSSLVKGCKSEKRTAKVWDGNEVTKKTSEAPIIEFDGKKCIWLNKEECEAGKEAVMELITRDLEEKAEPFDKKPGDYCYPDYSKAVKIRQQAESMFSKEALEQMVVVERSSEDGYESSVPISKDAELKLVDSQIAKLDKELELLRKRKKELTK